MTVIADLYPSLQYGIENLRLECLVEHKTVSIAINIG